MQQNCCTSLHPQQIDLDGDVVICAGAVDNAHSRGHIRFACHTVGLAGLLSNSCADTVQQYSNAAVQQYTRVGTQRVAPMMLE